MATNPFGQVMNTFQQGAQPNKYTESWAKYTNSLKPKATDPSQFLGSNFDYLQNNLKQSAEGNNPIFAQLFGNASRRIGASTDRNVQDIKEQGAQTGFRGAGGNLINDAYRGEQQALTGVSDNLAGQQLGFQQNAISQLLGLNQFEGGQGFGAFQSDRQNSQFGQSLAEQRRQFDEQMQYQKDNSGSSFWDVTGGVVGAATGALGGGFLGALGSKWA